MRLSRLTLANGRKSVLVILTMDLRYYSSMLLYIDNVILIHNDLDSVMAKLENYFLPNANSVGKPEIYLGAKLKLIQLKNDVWAWGLSLSKYVQVTVHKRLVGNVVDMLTTYP